jgi:hypothetical protein
VNLCGGFSAWTQRTTHNEHHIHTSMSFEHRLGATKPLLGAAAVENITSGGVAAVENITSGGVAAHVAAEKVTDLREGPTWSATNL